MIETVTAGAAGDFVGVRKETVRGERVLLREKREEFRVARNGDPAGDGIGGGGVLTEGADGVDVTTGS
jgi:hypothetical protein